MHHRSFLMVAFALVAAQAAGAQSASEHIAAGDKETAALNAPAALTHYEEAVKAEPTNYEALWKAARTAVDLGEAEKDATKRNTYYKTGEAFARRAVAANPNDAEGHFVLGRAIGRAALTLGPSDRVKYAKAVRNEALAALKLDPHHAGALHLLGMWNAEIMRLGGTARWFAKTFLGGQVFNEANWDNAQRYLEQAATAEPNRITHHLDLAGVYRDRGNKVRAREEYQKVLDLPATEYDDALYKQQAAEALRKL